MNEEKIRTSKEFKLLVDFIRAKCILMGVKCPSVAEITRRIAESINKERLWQDEFFEK